MPADDAPPPPGAAPRARESAAGRFVVPAVAIFVGAFLVRALNIWQLRAAPFFGYVGGDGRSYDEWAQEIVAGNWLGTEVFYQAPLYPYFLAVIYAVFDHDTVVVRFVQALIGAASCVLLALAARRFFDRRAGIVAGVMLSLYAPAIFYDGLIQKSVLDLFLLCLSLWIIAGLNLEATVRRWCGLGAAMGALVLSRENALVLFPAVLIWILFAFRPQGARRLVFAGCFLGAAAAVLLPVAVRNQVVGGEFHLTTSQFGPNFYIGNHAGADGSYKPLRPRRANPKFERLDATELAEQDEGRALAPAEVSAYWTRRALDDITDDPVRWLSLMGRKLALTWNAHELMDTEDLYTYAEYSLPLRLTRFVLNMGVLAPLALAGVWITWSRRRVLWPVYLMLATYAASVVLFFVFGRYRFPMVPFLVILAAGGLVGLPAFVRRADRGHLLQLAVFTIAVAVACNLPAVRAGGSEAAAAYNTGTSLGLQGRDDEAITHLREAIALDPSLASAHYNLGAIHARRGEPAEAQTHFEQAVAVAPDYAEAWSFLGVVLAEQNDTARARTCYEEALRHDARLAQAHSNLGRLLLAGGDVEAARAHFAQAVASDPDLAVAQLQLGLFLELEGDEAGALTCYEQAVRVDRDSAAAQLALGRVLVRRREGERALIALQRAVELDPQSAEAHRRLGSLLFRQRQPRRAIPHLETALTIDPRDAGAHNDLGTAYGSVGEIGRAVTHFEEALRLDPDFVEAKKNLERARGMRGG